MRLSAFMKAKDVEGVQCASESGSSLVSQHAMQQFVSHPREQTGAGKGWALRGSEMGEDCGEVRVLGPVGVSNYLRRC